MKKPGIDAATYFVKKWITMTTKPHVKIVLPFLVIIIVLISVAQFGRKPNVIVLLQANRSSKDIPRDLTQVIVDQNGVIAASITSLKNGDEQKNDVEINGETTGAPKHRVQQDNSDVQHSNSSVADTKSIGQGKHRRNQCKSAQNKLVFVKTHKTASTTVATVFERYGYGHNLTFALPWVTHIFTENELFNRDMVMTFDGQRTYDMLTNHARFNHKEMEAVVPDAKYVTIIRDPVTQFESAFGYFEMASSLGLSKKKDPLKEFLKDPEIYFRKRFHMKVQSYNGQMFDLGLNHQFHNDTSRVDKYIEKLDSELDLVMLTEYIDESLILLRNMMCWNYEDILYLSKGVRNKKHRYEMSADIAEEVRQWNRADLELYRHFNRTFWGKVDEYGPQFDKDLQRFRDLQTNMTTLCLDTNKQGLGDYRETSFAKKNNAPDICDDLLRDDIDFVKLIRWREVRTEFGLVKLFAIIIGGILLSIFLLTAILFIIAQCFRRLCDRTGPTTGDTITTKCSYRELENSDV